MDISKTYTNFWAWISDDEDIWPENSVTDMEGIDIRTHGRYIQADSAYLQTEDFTLAWGASWFKATPNGNFVSNITKVMRNGTDLSIWLSNYDGMEYEGSWTDQVNYFFSRTWGIQKMNYDGSATVGSAITSGYPTANVQVTAIGWHVSNLLFSKLNVVYYLNTTTVACATAVTLMPWTTVKAIYAYSLDSVVVVAINGGNTYIYELEFTWGAYNIVRKVTEEGRECISATGNKYDVFWADSEWVHQYQGWQTQMVKYLTWILRLSYYKNLIIGTSTSIYEFGAKKPWRKWSLTRTEQSTTLIDNDVVLINVSGGYKIYEKTGAFARDNRVLLRPLDWGIVNVPKSDLNYRLAYEFDTDTYVDDTTRQEIEIKVQTQEMKQTEDWVSVLTITDWDTTDSIGNPRFGYVDITPNMVTTALQADWYKSEYGYVSTDILIKAWDEYSWNPWLYRKSPKLYDITINANYVKK